MRRNDRHSTGQAAPTSRARTPAAVRRAAWAGGVGTVIEYYDYSLYGFLAVTLGPLFFPSEDPTTSLMAALVLFATGFVLRPVGGLIFGRIGDRYGRKTALIATLLSMGGASAAIAVLPTHASAGIAATVSLVVLRAVQGLSAGGEVGGSMTFIAESAENGRRATRGSATVIGTAVGFASAATVVGTVSLFLSEEAFASWGWRIPFLLSLPMCAFCLWLRGRSVETLGRQESSRPRGSVGRLMREDGWALLLTTFMSITIAGASIFGLSYLSVHLIEVVEMDATPVHWIAVVAITTSAAAAYGAGRVADRHGLMATTRKALALYAILAVPALLLMGTGTGVLVLAAYALILSCSMAASAPIVAALPLLFRSDHRYTGVTLGWNVGAVTSGATTPLVAVWLVETFESPLAPAGICILVCVIGFAASYPLHRALERKGEYIRTDDSVQPVVGAAPSA